MSTRVVTTCDGCGKTAGERPHMWRRWDTETYYLDGKKDMVSNVEVCPACARKIAAVIPDFHKAVE